MNYKRKKPRKFAKCKLCTPRKYIGHSLNRDKHGRGKWLDGKKLNKEKDLKEQKKNKLVENKTHKS